MKIKITYFYNLRFFQPYEIPLSTAMFDPFYFHKGKDVFIDKRGVYNGLRATPFVPGPTCKDKCHGHPCDFGPATCPFLKAYAEQLDRLDFDEMMSRFERIGVKIKDDLKFTEEPICVLMVYEKPDNPCSERVILKQWFAKYGYNLEEWVKGED